MKELTPATPISDDLLHFLDANVDSIEQLEVLRILAESPERQWSIPELATKAQAKPAAIIALEKRGLLRTQTIGSDLRCSAGATTTETDKALAALIRFYNERPVTLIKLVYARTDERLKAFADSFRLRKES